MEINGKPLTSLKNQQERRVIQSLKKYSTKYAERRKHTMTCFKLNMTMSVIQVTGSILPNSGWMANINCKRNIFEALNRKDIEK